MRQISEGRQTTWGWDCLCAPELLHKTRQLPNVPWSEQGAAGGPKARLPQHVARGPFRWSKLNFILQRFQTTAMTPAPRRHPDFECPSIRSRLKFFQLRSHVCTWQRGKIEAEKMHLNSRPGRADNDLAQHPPTAQVLDQEACVLFVKRYNKAKLLS